MVVKKKAQSIKSKHTRHSDSWDSSYVINTGLSIYQINF